MSDGDEYVDYDDDEYYDEDGEDEYYVYQSSDDEDGLEQGSQPSESIDIDDESPHVQEEEKDFIILNPKDVIKEQNEKIDKVRDFLGTTAGDSRLLLMFYQWDSEKLMSDFFERGADQVMEKAGVIPTETLDPSVEDRSAPFECHSCMDDEVEWEDTRANSCGHRFCTDCWSMHVPMRINEGHAKDVRCMQAKCDVLVDEEIINEVVDESTLTKYQNKMMDSFIEDNPMVKWCPSAPSCGNAVQITWKSAVDVDCVCGWSFCFKCQGNSHQPSTCKQLKQWDIKCKDDSETANWMASNTKECPNCHNMVEKNGGCNHVSCTCGSYFCWLCGAQTGRAHTWGSIEGHECGRYKDEAEKNANTAGAALKRYMHYFERFRGHQESLKFEKKLRSQVEVKRLHLYETTGQTMMDLKWLEQGVHAVFVCRRYLAHSYVYAFYMFSMGDVENSAIRDSLMVQKNLFEDQQTQLESNVEKLANLLETKEEDIDDRVRHEVINMTGLVRKRCAALADVIESQLEMDDGQDDEQTSASSSSSGDDARGSAANGGKGKRKKKGGFASFFGFGGKNEDEEADLQLAISRSMAES